MRAHAVSRATLVLIALSLVISTASGQAQTARARIALFEPSGQKADVTLTAALCTVADSVELDLACLQRYEVRRLPAVDPASELGKVRAYCRDNRIDQAIIGSGSAQPAGGYAFKLALYDRRTDAITMVQEGACSGALDMFDATDALVAALLDKLSGTHLLFGALVIETDPPGAVVTVNGMEVGPAPLSLRGLPVGIVTVSAHAPGWEDTAVSVKIEDEQITNTALSLARSMGTIVLDMPEDALVSIRAAGMEEKLVWSSSMEELPTGNYHVEASCPGLPAVVQEISIQRDTTSRWMPWSKGYFSVESDPPDARVVVDGVDRGAAPLVVEVDPGVLHRVELRKDKYEYYRADLSALTARKVSFEPVLDLKPGSIRVETNPPGVQVRLDHGSYSKTPCTFEAVKAGPHTLTIWDGVPINRRFYTTAHTVAVTVNPEEQTSLTPIMEPASAHLEILDAPPSSSVLVDGQRWFPGADIPAGTLTLAVSSPSGQVWKTDVTASPGSTLRLSLDSFVASLPHRTVKVDGKTDDWDGIEPLWGGVKEKGPSYYFVGVTSHTNPFPNQKGTRLLNAYLCRDDANIYVRLDFDDGTPDMNLSKDVRDSLMREVQCRLPDRKTLMLQVGSGRQWGTIAQMAIWDDASRSSTTIGYLNAYAMAGSTMEFAVPISRVRKFLAGPVDTFVDIVDASNSGWTAGYSTYHRSVDFLN